MDAGAYQCGKTAWEMPVCVDFASAGDVWEQGLSGCGLCHEWNDCFGQQTAQGKEAVGLYTPREADACHDGDLISPRGSGGHASRAVDDGGRGDDSILTGCIADADASVIEKCGADFAGYVYSTAISYFIGECGQPPD